MDQEVPCPGWGGALEASPSIISSFPELPKAPDAPCGESLTRDLSRWSSEVKSWQGHPFRLPAFTGPITPSFKSHYS